MKKQLLTIFFLILTMSISYGQVSVKGKVTSSDDQSELPGVTILVKGNTSGTVTNASGEYSLEVPEDAILLFSFVGYETQEVAVGNRSTIDVLMQLDIETLSEVVVIGYGEVDKDDLTGAVATLGTKDFNQGVTTSPQDLLTGRIAGVSVTSANGAPGSGATIRIRGGSSLGGATNDPLIVIDGFPIDDGAVSGLANPLSTINPNDIESFTVLKDASAAAIYGSRASNGVIIITTKKGSEGKLKFNFNAQVSVSTPTNQLDVLTGDEYRALISDLVTPPNTLSGVDQNTMLKLGAENTDWQDEIYQTAISQNYNLSVSGAAGKIPFRASYGYTDQEGVLKTTNTKRHSLSLNINPSLLNDDLKININAKGTLANTNFGDQGAVGAAVNYDPTQPVRNGNSRYGGFFQYTDVILPDGTMSPESNPNFFVSNPVSLLELRDNHANVNRFTGNVQLNYRLPFLPDLSANLNVGMDKTSTDGEDNADAGLPWVYQNYEGENGRLLDYTNSTSSDLLEYYMQYTKTSGIHSIDLTGGYSWQHFERESTTFERNGDGTQVVEDSKFKSENFLVSFFGRLIYTVNDKYILTASLRQDGTSRFVGDNKWGLFPAAAFAWKINEESFLKDVETVSLLKLRLGYGVTGQQGLSADLVNDPYYPALAKYQRSTIGASYQFGNQFYNTLRPDAYDANLKWEETTTYNIGLDFGLWADKITGSVDVYQRKTEDLLNRIPISDGNNFGNFLTTNVGSMDIKGYEISLMTRPVTTADFTWSLGANLSYNQREITQLNKTDDPNDPGVATGEFGNLGSTIQIYTVGQAPNSFYTFQQVYNQSGQPMEGLYVDRTGNGGDVTGSEFNKYHNRTPYADYLIGINSRMSYKGLDFSFSGRVSLGNYVYNSNLAGDTYASLYEESGTGYFANMRSTAADIGFENPQYYSDMYIQNASFFKLDNISLGYTLDNVIAEGLKARISITVQNALVISDYDGVDPEVDGGIDNNAYPRPRIYLLGLNLNF